MADIINQNTGIPVNEVKTPTTADPVINCNLEVALNPENVVVYLRQGIQCFNFTALKCCCNSNISIVPISATAGAGGTIVGNTITVFNFGTFTTNNSGICVQPLSSLNTITTATITFTATSTVDGCVTTTTFDVKFVYDPCRFCCKSRKCK